MVAAALRRGRPGRDVLLDALGTVHCAGGAVDWPAHFTPRGRVVSLPLYPWQRKRYWRERSEQRAVAVDRARAEAPLYQLAWRRVERPAAGQRGTGRWLVLADAGGIGSALAQALSEAGLACVVATRDAVQPFETLLREAFGTERCAGVV